MQVEEAVIWKQTDEWWWESGMQGVYIASRLTRRAKHHNKSSCNLTKGRISRQILKAFQHNREIILDY